MSIPPSELYYTSDDEIERTSDSVAATHANKTVHDNERNENGTIQEILVRYNVSLGTWLSIRVCECVIGR